MKSYPDYQEYVLSTRLGVWLQVVRSGVGNQGDILEPGVEPRFSTLLVELVCCNIQMLLPFISQSWSQLKWVTLLFCMAGLALSCLQTFHRTEIAFRNHPHPLEHACWLLFLIWTIIRNTYLLYYFTSKWTCKVPLRFRNC